MRQLNFDLAAPVGGRPAGIARHAARPVLAQAAETLHRLGYRASRSTSSACTDSGTRCALPVFIDSAGFTHTAASTSNWSQVARRTWICRAPVSAVNRIAAQAPGSILPLQTDGERPSGPPRT